jgi:hypothetical protein
MELVKTLLQNILHGIFGVECDKPETPRPLCPVIIHNDNISYDPELLKILPELVFR